MTRKFRQTLNPKVMVAAAVIVVVAFGLIGFNAEPAQRTALWLAFLVTNVGLTLVFAMFARFTVEVGDQAVRWWFGWGWPNWTLAADQIAAAEPVRNRWWYGWGIRLTPSGWLFNASGLDAIELTDTSGRKRRLGTNQPIEMGAAIKLLIRAAR